MNRCADCNKNISKYAKRCSSCHNRHRDFQGLKGNKNPMYKNGNWCNPYYCSDCGKQISYNSGRKGQGRCVQCSGKYYSGKNRWNWTKGLPKCKDCNKELSTYDSQYCNKCKGKHIKEWVKSSRQPIRINYKNILFRSSYEANFAIWCDLSGIVWKYEPKKFVLKNTHYIPDFYLPKFNCYIEIKGYWKPEEVIKKRLFKKQYPNIFILYYMRNDLRNIGIMVN